MGKERIRNLQALGLKKIVGFDIREDERTEAVEIYNIKVVESFEEGISSFKIDALIISLPPDIHHIYKESIRLIYSVFYRSECNRY